MAIHDVHAVPKFASPKTRTCQAILLKSILPHLFCFGAIVSSVSSIGPSWLIPISYSFHLNKLSLYTLQNSCSCTFGFISRYKLNSSMTLHSEPAAFNFREEKIRLQKERKIEIIFVDEHIPFETLRFFHH